mmetsp:Transcript_73925/g.154067  ORF Transcript_73925/g.154067 Transcript_73925/m.154067 type:complete len:214 (-) Transcript_73925:1894-2535(-)
MRQMTRKTASTSVTSASCAATPRGSSSRCPKRERSMPPARGPTPSARWSSTAVASPCSPVPSSPSPLRALLASSCTARPRERSSWVRATLRTIRARTMTGSIGCSRRRSPSTHPRPPLKVRPRLPRTRQLLRLKSARVVVTTTIFLMTLRRTWERTSPSTLRTKPATTRRRRTQVLLAAAAAAASLAPKWSPKRPPPSQILARTRMYCTKATS